MSDRLEIYRSQHAELLAVAGALEALLGFDAPAPGAIRDVLPGWPAS